MTDRNASSSEKSSAVFDDEAVVVTSQEILQLLPHRGPAVKIDSAIFFENEKKIVASRKITATDRDLDGHFPGNPILPGYSMIESANLAAVVLVKKLYPEMANLLPLSTRVNLEFGRMVRPETTISFEVSLITRTPGRFGKDSYHFSVEIYSKTGKLIASGFVVGASSNKS